MSSDEEAREVVERMAALRRALDTDVEHVAESAKAMTDWTFYVRRFPWAAVGLAAVAGYLLVPRKKNANISPTAEQLAALVNNKEFVAAATEQLKPPQSLLKGLAATLAAMAGRAALAYVTEQIRAKAAGAHPESASTAQSGNGARDIEF